MKITNETKRQFAKSITSAIEFLNDDDTEMFNPCIYAETGGETRKEMGFHFGPEEHMQDGDILAMKIEPDSFGEYDRNADPEDEADLIASALWDDVIGEVVELMEEED